MTTEVKLVKAAITNLNTDQTLEVLFNPSEYILTKQTIYTEKKPQGGKTSYINYSSGRRRELRVELFFDTTDSGKDVTEYTKQLESFMEIAENKDGSTSSPSLMFAWGSLKFSCVLEDLKMQFTKFAADGTPLRVIVRTVFLEYIPMGQSASSSTQGGSGTPTGM